MDDDLIGKPFGDYVIQDVIGSGGMGVVYEAHDRPLDRRVALKVLQQSSLDHEEAIKRFQREGRLAAKIRHPAVVTVYAAGTEGGNPFLAMEIVKGQTLEDLIASKGRIPVAEALRIVREAATGLDAMHQEGLVHRDIKPGNIMIEEGGRVCIMDFGLAKRLDIKSDITQEPGLMGTIRYMAPELFRGSEAEKTTDVYALGLTCYELLAGVSPFSGVNQAEVVSKVVEGRGDLLTRHLPGVAQEVVELVDSMMATRIEDRCPHAGEAVHAIDACLERLDVERARRATQPTEISDGRAFSSGPPYYGKAANAHRLLLLDAVCALILIGGLALPHPLSDIKYLAMKQHTRSQQIVLIDLEAWSVQSAGDLESVIRSLNEHGAPVVGLDILLTSDSSLDRPESLRQVISESGNVVLATDLASNHGEGLLPGFADLASGIGFANISADWDKRVRTVRLTYPSVKGPVPKSLALVLAEQFEQSASPAESALDKGAPSSSAETGSPFPHEIVLDYGALKANTPIRAQLLAEIAQGWAEGYCRDKVFLIGTTCASSLEGDSSSRTALSSGDCGEDLLATPLWGDDGRVPGLLLQGCILDNLLNRRWFLRVPKWVNAIVLMVALALGSLCGSRIPLRWAIPVWILLILLGTLASALALRYFSVDVRLSLPSILFVGSSIVTLWRARKWNITSTAVSQ